MDSLRAWRKWSLVVGAILLSAIFAIAVVPSATAQTTISTGSIQGTVTDPTAAVVPGAQVTITSKDTGQTVILTTTSTGTYNSGPLHPGNYLVRVQAPNFKTTELPVIVEVGTTESGNLQLQLGAVTETVKVTPEAVNVNTEQAIIQGVLTTQQIENLPVNGRNFLDLAQLEPGVQIQDGNNFDPTKVGYSSISFGGRFGRTARIEVDGGDVSDETVGTTTTDIPSSAIQEFQLSQSTLDLSSELTSSGSVNVVTRSGTNDYRGEVFYLFRDSRVGAAALPGPKAPFQRNQFGGNAGGPIIKNELFFFADGERTKQDLFAPVPLPAPFSSFSGGFNSPFRENDLLGKLDWQPKSAMRVFYRFSYFGNLAVSTFGAISFQPFKDKNYTRSHVVGADFNTGSFTHSVRFEYLKFQNDLADAVLGTGLPLASFPVSILISTQNFRTGPNLLAPQATLQSDHQFKYDGSKIIASHILRYGVTFNHLQGGGFVKTFSLTPTVVALGSSSEVAAAASGPFQGGAGDPLNYPVDVAVVGNGLGFATEKPSFGYPLGGLTDNRFGIYLGDSWKARPNLTLTAGMRYVRDTGRTDSDLPTLAAVNAVLPGLGNRVEQANKNLAPQLGIAWDPRSNGKSVIRAGVGIFYESVIWNNVFFDRPERLPKGGFLSTAAACFFGVPQAVPFADGSVQTPPASACSGLIGNSAAALAAFQLQFQAVAASVGGNAANPGYLPSLIAKGAPIPPGTFAPGYETPRSVQMNFGFQHEIRPGLVVSTDYLRNISTHYLLGIDANHTGSVRFFNANAANAAINATNTGFGCPPGPAGINCAIVAMGTNVSIGPYAANGLDSAGDLGIGSCPLNGLPAGCAFGGINPAVGPAPFLFPVGRAVYNALDVKLVQNMAKPFPGIRHANFQFSYSMSRFVNSGGANPSVPEHSDQDFAVNAVDNDKPLAFTGPSTLDRTHQLSFGGTFEVAGGFRFSVISHFYSPLSTTLVVPNTGLGPGEIFRTDFTGDGTVDDILPGTRVGSFDRGVSASNINTVISNYNATVAGQPTPAGQVLIANGLFTLAQLQAMGAVAPQVALAPPGQVNLDWLRAFDVKLGWVHKIRERYTIELSVAFFNVLNFANFDLPTSILSGLLTNAPGAINGTTYNQQTAQRVGVGTGVFGLGSPRVAEFGLKLSF